MKIFGNTRASYHGEVASYLIDTGVANAYAVATHPSISAHTAGLKIVFMATNANTGASTLSVNGFPADPIKKNVTTDLSSDDIKANQIIVVRHDGTNWQLLSGAGNGGDTVSADNAITESSPGHVQLGGPLIQNTEITAAYNIAITEGSLSLGTNNPQQARIRAEKLAGQDGLPIQGYKTTDPSGTDFGAAISGARHITTTGSSFNVAQTGVYGEFGITNDTGFTYSGSGAYTGLSGVVGVFTKYSNSGNLSAGNSLFAGGTYYSNLAGSGNIDKLAAIRGLYPIQAPGYAAYTGTVTNFYGLYLDSSSSSAFTITNRYGVYQAGANDKNFFAGLVNMDKLKTGVTAPTTSGTTKMVITDANGQLSFTDIGTVSLTNKYVAYGDTSNLLTGSSKLQFDATGNGILSVSNGIGTYGMMNLQKLVIQNQGTSDSQTSTGFGVLYTKTDGKIYYRYESGTVYDLTSGGSGTAADWNGIVEGTNISNVGININGTTDVPVYIFNGTSANYNIPTAAGSSNKQYIFKNAGSGTLSINVAAGSGDLIIDNGAGTGAYSIGPGKSAWFSSDGVNTWYASFMTPNGYRFGYVGEDTTLTADRTVTMNSYGLTLSKNSGQYALSITNSGGSAAYFTNSTGNSTATFSNTANASAIYATSNTGAAVQASSSSGGVVFDGQTTNSGATQGGQTILNLKVNPTAGVTPGTGFGSRILWWANGYFLSDIRTVSANGTWTPEGRAGNMEFYLANPGAGYTSNLTLKLLYTGDIEAPTAGMGFVVKSPDGTKRLRYGVDNAGNPTYTLI